MNNYILISSILIITACAQLSNGELQPVKTKDLAKEIYSTNCGGTVENWGTCKNKANNTCKKGFIMLAQEQDSYGIKRELIFQCKK